MIEIYKSPDGKYTTITNTVSGVISLTIQVIGETDLEIYNEYSVTSLDCVCNDWSILPNYTVFDNYIALTISNRFGDGHGRIVIMTKEPTAEVITSDGKKHIITKY